jgi:transmembrane sensor
MEQAMSRPQPDTISVRDGAGQRLLADPALAEALADPAGFERLSDADIRAMRARRRQTLGAAAAACLVLILGAGGWWQTSSTASEPTTDHYATRRGEHAEIRLADGSTVTLDGATRLDVTLAADRRTVALQTGEAYFDVAHDPARPFTVSAGASSARVLGTAFDLNRTRGQVQLDVYRGAVRFGGARSDASGKVVRAGWRSRFADGGATEPRQFDRGREGWRRGWLDTDDMPLADVVEAINRKGGTLVLSPPASLADIRVAGRFRLDDPASLLGALGEAYGFRVRHGGDGLHLEPGAPS